MTKFWGERFWLTATLVAAVTVGGCTGDSVVTTTGMDAAADIVCSGAAIRCGSSCADLRSDPVNCGACGNACGPSMLCTNGTCQLTCAGGASACSGSCVNLQTDNANCGRCGQACAAGQVCSLGRCSLTCAASLATCGGGDAGADAGGTQRCADLSTDNNNCGACGTLCPAGQRCLDRRCQVTCSVGQTTCNGVCRDLQTDNLNCGACGTTCAAGTTCSAGVCVVSCSASLTQCSGTCVNLQTDNANCGNCGLACAPGQVCSRGTCATSCATTLATCPSSAGAYCANTAVDPANCGACGHGCTLPNTAITGCTVGSCSVVRCATGFGDCDADPANGCESGTTDSVTNCGACGRACVLPHATATCAASACAIGTCAPGFADCDGVAANGCEVNTQADNGNCGTCGTSCPAGQVCSGGTCGTTCAAPLAACTGVSAAYCANTQNDPSNCGACGRNCALAHTAVTSCVAGACAVASCAANFADCDRDATSGCEANLQTDNANCGACGRACVLANAASTCTAGACAVTTCNAGFRDCNGVAIDGCEVNTQTDNANCGACGVTCTAGRVCSGGVCGTTCASPLVTCGVAPATYCSNTSIDPSNCGACGTVCALPHTAADGCASGSCTVQRCVPGFGDCDNSPSNGCEATLATDNTNCGACGRGCLTGQTCTGGACLCPAGQTACGGACTPTATDLANCGSCGHACALAYATAVCSTGACAIAACSTGFADCDHVPATGCETNVRVDSANCGSCGHACPGGQVCSAGVCTTTCGAGLTTCGASCVNTSTDPSNCGACSTVCPAVSNATAVCAAGTCSFVCNTGFALIGGACVATSTTVTFPSTGSTVGGPAGGGTLGAGGGGARFRTGDFVSEVFPRATSVTSLSVNFQMSDLTSTSPCVTGMMTWNVMVNGTVVGTYGWAAGTGVNPRTVTQTYSFAPIAPVSGNVTLEFIALTTVCPGASSWNWIAGGSATMM